MRIGQLHIAALTGAGLATIAPEILALQMPMMLRSDAELDYVRQRIGPRLEAILEAKGFKVLTWGDAGWVHFFAQRPVVTPDDLKPQKLFTWAGDTATLEAWEKSGFRPVPLAATDIHIDYINAHGTSTPVGDPIELSAVARLFDGAAGRLSMSSTKSSTGHLLGAAGSIEAIFSVLAIVDGVVPPTLNLDNPPLDCGIDLVPHRARERSVRAVLSNSFGFGGTNATLIFAAYG
jgi:hypothetical protein